MTLNGIPRTGKHSGSNSGTVSVVINTPMGGWMRRDGSPMHCLTVWAGVSLSWCDGKRVHGCRRCARRKRAEHPCLAPTHVGDSIRQARTLLVIEETPVVREIREGPPEDTVD